MTGEGFVYLLPIAVVWLMFQFMSDSHDPTRPDTSVKSEGGDPRQDSKDQKDAEDQR